MIGDRRAGITELLAAALVAAVVVLIVLVAGMFAGPAAGGGQRPPIESTGTELTGQRVGGPPAGR